jgi:hypothetical protein
MKLTLKDSAVLAIVLVNLLAVFYWGGTTRSRVDFAQESLQQFIQDQRIQHATFQRTLMNHEGRISATEALTEE